MFAHFAEAVDRPKIVLILADDLGDTDWKPLMRDPEQKLAPRALHGLPYPVVFQYKNEYQQRSAGPVGSLRQGKWKWIAFFATPQGQPHGLELYDFEADPSEQHDVSAERPEKVV